MNAKGLRAAIGASLLLFGGCAKVRYPTTYVLNIPPAPSRPANASAPLGSIVVRRFRSPEYLSDGGIVYRPGPEQIASYAYHRWATDPRDSMTQLVADRVRSRSRFRHVATPEPRIEPAYILSGSIDRLEEVDDGRLVQVVCALSMRITDAETGSVVWSDTASETLPVTDRNMVGVVRSLSAAAQSVVEQLVGSMAAQLGSSGQNRAASGRQTSPTW